MLRSGACCAASLECELVSLLDVEKSIPDSADVFSFSPLASSDSPRNPATVSSHLLTPNIDGPKPLVFPLICSWIHTLLILPIKSKSTPSSPASYPGDNQLSESTIRGVGRGLRIKGGNNCYFRRARQKTCTSLSSCAIISSLYFRPIVSGLY